MNDGMIPQEAPRAEQLELLRELGDLKRVRSAARQGSIAERLFADAWARLVEGTPSEHVWRTTTAAALAATRLGDLDPETLATVGITGDAAEDVRVSALEDAGATLDPALRAALRDVPVLPAPYPSALPAFVAALSRQPRAGVTCPGRPRLLLEPPENHAEHCLMVAVYGVLLSPVYRANPGIVFLAGLAHHLHNALLPDSGFVGEELLGAHLEDAFAAATELALAELPPPLAKLLREARRILPDAGSPEGRAFHAADTLDRVLQIEQHLRAGQATMRYVLHDMALVHAGPVKNFQDRVLAATGLLS